MGNKGKHAAFNRPANCGKMILQRFLPLGTGKQGKILDIQNFTFRRLQKMIAGNIIVESRFLTESGKLFFPAVINKPVDFGADFYFQPAPAGSPADIFRMTGKIFRRRDKTGAVNMIVGTVHPARKRTAAGNIFVHDQVVADTDLPPAEFFGPVKHFFNRVVPVGKNGMGVITEVLHQRFNLQRLV